MYHVSSLSVLSATVGLCVTYQFMMKLIEARAQFSSSSIPANKSVCHVDTEKFVICRVGKEEGMSAASDTIFAIFLSIPSRHLPNSVFCRVQKWVKDQRQQKPANRLTK